MLLALTAALAVASGTSVELVEGRPAPEHGLRVWLERDRDPGATLAALSGRVVIVRALDWRGPQDFRQVSPLVGDLLAANADRGLTAIGVAAPARGLDVDARAAQMGLTHPVALCAPGRSPYFDPDVTGLPFASVIGPSGELVWKGDPVQGREAFLGAVRTALGRHPTRPIDAALSAEFDAALGAWYAGRWDEARRLARELEARDARTAQLVARFVRHVDAFEHQCARELDEHLALNRALAYCRLIDAFGRGFPRSKGLGDALTAFERERAGPDGWRWLEAQRFAELERERPVLFPVQVDEPARRYLARLHKMLKGAREETEVTRKVRALIAAR